MTRDAAKHGRDCDPVASLCSTIGCRCESDTQRHRDFVKVLPKLGVDVEHLIHQVDGEHFLQIIPLRKLYQHLHKHHREKLDQIMGPPELVFKYWDDLRMSSFGADLWSQHAELKDRTPLDLKRTWPLTLHADAGPHTKSLSLSVVSTSTILGIGAELGVGMMISSRHCD